MGKKKGKKRSKPAIRSAQYFSAWIVLAFFALAGGLYLNTLGHGFVLDDEALIGQYPQVYKLQWGEILSSAGYRPIRTLTYALQYAVHGENPFWFHLFNTILHALNVVLLLRLLWRWTESRVVAGVAGLLFAVHPVQTAAVAYISGRKDLLATFFVLAALLVYTRYRTSGRRVHLIATLSLFALGVLSKESAIVFPGLLLLADLLVFSKGESQGLRANLIGVLRRAKVFYAVVAFGAATGIYYALYVTGATRMTEYWGGSLETNLGTSFKLFSHHLKLFLWPHPLIADYKGDVFSPSTGLTEPATLLAIVLVVVFLAAAFRISSSRPLAAFGMLWFFLTLLPILHLIPFHELTADHFLYLPSVGGVLVAGIFFGEVASRARFKTLAYLTLGLLAVAASLRTFDRNRDWQNRSTLWQATYLDAPGSFRANVNLGHLYVQAGISRKDAALVARGVAMTRKALTLLPGDALASGNLGASLFEQARMSSKGLESNIPRVREAMSFLRHSIAKEPTNPVTISNLGNCHKFLANYWDSEGRPELARNERGRAEELYREALKKDSRKTTQAVRFNLGLLYFDQGDPRRNRRPYFRAIRQLELFLERAPEQFKAMFFEAHFYIGRSWFELGAFGPAAESFEEALSLRPDLATFGYRAKCSEAIQDSRGATAVYERALGAFPTSKEVLYNLGVLYRKLGQSDPAIRYLEKAVQGEEAHQWSGMAHLFLAHLYSEAGAREQSRRHLKASKELGVDAQGAGGIPRRPNL